MIVWVVISVTFLSLVNLDHVQLAKIVFTSKQKQNVFYINKLTRTIRSGFYGVNSNEYSDGNRTSACIEDK